MPGITVGFLRDRAIQQRSGLPGLIQALLSP